VARTDGVALFVEELTNTVLESGLLAETGDRYELSGPVPSFAIPANLHDSLMARVDRLAPIKAEASLYRSIETARDQEATSLELRAATSLARLRREQGKPDEDRGVLAGVRLVRRGFRDR
jgi:hypothetical protein